MSNQPTTKVVKGMRFRSVVADSNSLWETVRPTGRSAWIAVCVDEPYKMSDGRSIPSDYAGTEKAFLNKDILNTLAWAKTWENAGDENAEWWDAQEIGSIVHYCDGFNVFFRGVVEIGESIHKPGEQTKGIRVTALVGPRFKPNEVDANGEDIPNTFEQGIRDHDLPRIDASGNVNMGRYADKIGKFWTPSHTCMYENPSSSYRRRGVDPTLLPDIDLTPPTPDDEQRLMADLNDTRTWAAARLNETPRAGTDAASMATHLRNIAEAILSSIDTVSQRV